MTFKEKFEDLVGKVLVSVENRITHDRWAE
jgi:hypothetical protein